MPDTCSGYSRVGAGELGCRNTGGTGAMAGSSSRGDEMSVTSNCVRKNRDVSKEKPSLFSVFIVMVKNMKVPSS